MAETPGEAAGEELSAQPRQGLVRLPVQDHGDVCLDVYWREDPEGRGPACSLYARGLEVLRLDAFGGDQGHLHVNAAPGLDKRWYFQPGSVEEHVERAAFEIATNVNAILKLHREPSVERLWVDRERLREVASQARNLMLELVRQHQRGGGE